MRKNASTANANAICDNAKLNFNDCVQLALLPSSNTTVTMQSSESTSIVVFGK